MALSLLPTIAATRDDVLLIDPTAPLVAVPAQEGAEAGAGGGLFGGLLSGFGGYRVTSILIRAEDRIAVVNDQRVRVGDSLGNARVIAIEPGSVTLDIAGESRELQVHENSIKTLVKGDGE
jgi:hypothetical protein